MGNMEECFSTETANMHRNVLPTYRSIHDVKKRVGLPRKRVDFALLTDCIIAFWFHSSLLLMWGGVIYHDLACTSPLQMNISAEVPYRINLKLASR